MRRRTFIRGAVGALALTGAACQPESRSPSPSPSLDGVGAAAPFDALQSSASQLVDVSGGRTLAIETGSRSIRLFGPDGSESWTLGEDVLHGPTHALEWDGRIAVLDRSGRVILVADDGAVSASLPGGDPLLAPSGAAVLDDGRLAVSDLLTHRVVALGTDGSLEVLFEDTEGQGAVLNGPAGIALGRDGDLHIVSSGNARIEVVRQTGQWVRSYGGLDDGLRVPRGIAMDDNGRALVADPVAGAVFAFEAGTLVERFDTLRNDGFAASPRTIQVLENGTVRIGTV